jgi:hypothetical protein
MHVRRSRHGDSWVLVLVWALTLAGWSLVGPIGVNEVEWEGWQLGTYVKALTSNISLSHPPHHIHCFRVVVGLESGMDGSSQQHMLCSNLIRTREHDQLSVSISLISVSCPQTHRDRVLSHIYGSGSPPESRLELEGRLGCFARQV